MASEGAALLGEVLTSEKVYYAEYDTFCDTPATLLVDATGNKYFTTFTLSGVSASGFTASTSGAGDASGITVTMEYDNTTPGGATISYSGL